MSAANKTPESADSVARHSLRAAAGSVLVHDLADAAWHVLNHDNDPFNGDEWNTANWITTCQALRAVLKKHRISPNAPGERRRAEDAGLA